jgi:hypothetical protein
LIIGQSTSSLSIEGVAASTFEMTDTYGDSESKDTVKSEPIPISSSRELRDSPVQCWPAVDYRLDAAYEDYPYKTS